MFTVLITGGIGSGKSAVCAYLAEMGVPVYDSDSRAKSLYGSDHGLVHRLEEMAGRRLVRDDGTFDHKGLASVIFADAAKLAECESLVHPAVLEDFRKWRKAASGDTDGCGFVCMESAIAFDRPLFRREYDCSVLVDAPAGLRVERACRRDGADREALMKRVMAQSLPDKEEVDYVIENDGSMADLKMRVDLVFGQIAAIVKSNGCGRSREK